MLSHNNSQSKQKLTCWKNGIEAEVNLDVPILNTPPNDFCNNKCSSLSPLLPSTNIRFNQDVPQSEALPLLTFATTPIFFIGFS